MRVRRFSSKVPVFKRPIVQKKFEDHWFTVSRVSNKNN